MDENRTEVLKIPDGTPRPDEAYYMITAEDIGKREIRTTAGTIRFGDNWNDLNDMITREDVGRRIIGLENKGHDGPAYYWAMA